MTGPSTDLIDFRRRLHHHPELRFREVETARQIEMELEGVVDRLISGVAGTGIIVEIEGEAPGPRVLYRADIDAYPVGDAKNVPYASDNPGVTHACGHDVHMAVLVGVLRRFAASRPRAGTIVGLFQPAEEIPFGEPSGARTVIESGALGPGPYAAVLGLHCWPDLDAGSIGINASVSMAAKDAFRITVRGVSAHAALPERGRDAIAAASSIIGGVYQISSRRHDPGEMVAVNFGTIHGGVVQSAVPAECVLTGTLRTTDPGVRTRMRAVIEDVCAGAALQYEVGVDVDWADAMEPVINSPALVAHAQDWLPAIAPLVELPAPMTTDDFAVLTTLGDALYLKLGVRTPGSSRSPALHSPQFDVDERCIEVGVRALEELGRRVLASAADSAEDSDTIGWKEEITA